VVLVLLGRRVPLGDPEGLVQGIRRYLPVAGQNIVGSATCVHESLLSRTRPFNLARIPSRVGTRRINIGKFVPA
jgi:hypothetical protein